MRTVPETEVAVGILVSNEIILTHQFLYLTRKTALSTIIDKNDFKVLIALLGQGIEAALNTIVLPVTV
jgi:ribose 5-phosphate isomerase RpiB